MKDLRRILMRLLALATGFAGVSVSAQIPPQSSVAVNGTVAPALSPRNANYTIAATLQPSDRTIVGREVIAWRNITAKPASEIQFHLYWNAWRNNRSTWMREWALSGRDVSNVPEADRGAIDVTALALVSGPDLESAPIADLAPSRHFIAPDDGNAEDETVLATPLPQPVGPGETRW